MNLEEVKQALEDVTRLFSSYEAGLDDRMIVEPVVVAAARAYVDLMEGAEEVWWCVPFHEHGAANVSEPCVAGSNHDRPYECRWVRLVPVSEGEQ